MDVFINGIAQAVNEAVATAVYPLGAQFESPEDGNVYIYAFFSAAASAGRMVEFYSEAAGVLMAKVATTASTIPCGGAILHAATSGTYNWVLRKGVGSIFMVSATGAQVRLAKGTAVGGQLKAAASTTDMILAKSIVANIAGERTEAYINCL